MTDLIQAQVDDLIAVVTAHSSSIGAALVREAERESKVLLEWLGYLLTSVQAPAQESLVLGTHSAVVEVATCLSLGLVRPSLFGLRAQMEMSLAWLYFKDHPVEWQHSQRRAGEAKLRAEVLKYLGQYSPGFKARMSMLSNHKTRVHDDPYGTLSAHVHSLTQATAPTSKKLSAVVYSEPRCREVLVLQASVSEYLGDVFSSFLFSRWADLPPTIRDALEKRLSPAKLKDFLTAGDES